MKTEPVIQTITSLFIGAVSLIANAENPAVGLYESHRQKDSAYKPQQTYTGANPSLLPCNKRAQRLPDVGPYNGRGVYNPDSWPAPTEYIGQDGTILYCDKKGNVYDSNGVRYGKRESTGLLRKLTKEEQVYDAVFSPNYAYEAFKSEELKFKNDNKSKKKSPFEDESKQGDITSLISKNKEMPRPLRREKEEWIVEPMVSKSASEILKSEQDKGDKGVENCLFPELVKMGFDGGCENNDETVVKHEKENSQGSDRVDGGNAKGQEDYSDPTKFINKYIVNGEEAKRRCPTELMKQLRLKKIEIEHARLRTKQGYTTVCATLRLVPESPNIKYKLDLSHYGSRLLGMDTDAKVLTTEEVKKWFSADVEIPRIRMDNGIFSPMDQGDGWIQGWGSLDCIVIVN